MDAHKLRAAEESGLKVLEGTGDLADIAVNEVKVDMFADDLDEGDQRIRDADQSRARSEGEGLRVILLLEAELIQKGEEGIRPRRLKEVIESADAVAFIGEAGRGREEDDIGGVIEAADFASGLEAIDARHHDVEQIEGEVLTTSGFEHLEGTMEDLTAGGRVMLSAPLVKQGAKVIQVLDFVLADRQIHVPASLSGFK